MELRLALGASSMARVMTAAKRAANNRWYWRNRARVCNEVRERYWRDKLKGADPGPAGSALLASAAPRRFSFPSR